MDVTQRVRDTNVWYLDYDPLSVVDQDIIAFIKARAGKHLLDYGCGTGGYALMLQRDGYEVEAIDPNEEYVKMAKKIGVKAQALKSKKLPYKDKSFDTVFLIEVIEHLDDKVLAATFQEAARVARKNVLITTPNSTAQERLAGSLVTYAHMLERDHKQFYTRDGLTEKMKPYFKKVDIQQKNPIYPHRLLPQIVRRPVGLLYKAGVLHPDLFYRFYIEATVK